MAGGQGWWFERGREPGTFEKCCRGSNCTLSPRRGPPEDSLLQGLLAVHVRVVQAACLGRILHQIAFTKLT